MVDRQAAYAEQLEPWTGEIQRVLERLTDVGELRSPLERLEGNAFQEHQQQGAERVDGSYYTANQRFEPTQGFQSGSFGHGQGHAHGV